MTSYFCEIFHWTQLTIGWLHRHMEEKNAVWNVQNRAIDVIEGLQLKESKLSCVLCINLHAAACCQVRAMYLPRVTAVLSGSDLMWGTYSTLLSPRDMSLFGVVLGGSDGARCPLDFLANLVKSHEVNLWDVSQVDLNWIRSLVPETDRFESSSKSSWPVTSANHI